MKLQAYLVFADTKPADLNHLDQPIWYRLYPAVRREPGRRGDYRRRWFPPEGEERLLAELRRRALGGERITVAMLAAEISSMVEKPVAEKDVAKWLRRQGFMRIKANKITPKPAVPIMPRSPAEAA